MPKIRRHYELEVFRRAADAAMRVFELTQNFPREELYSLTDQVRRSSRSVCANVAEGWRKRRYPAAFIHKLSDAEAEAAETQVWIAFAVRCGYLPREAGVELNGEYEAILRMIVGMIRNHRIWTIGPPAAE